MPLKPQVTKLNFNEHIAVETKKNIVVIHHSAGWDNARGMYDWWRNDKYNGVCTAYGIVDSGEIFEGFDPKFWGYAINPGGGNVPAKYKTKAHDKFLNSQAVQIEICNWGALTEKGGKLYSWSGAVVDPSRAIYYKDGFRGFKWFERYTLAEIESLKNLLLWFHTEFGISLEYHEDMWDTSTRALDGEPGIWAHVSYRPDKSDAHPQPELIEMLRSLNTITPGRSTSKDI
ncbi:MAG: hypothetical protein A2W93_14250 [Bacteroidetes bacterium GWF2_43_63]|nr:MAG: hypothetical protein A2W94_00820 [Bacteroidetes bacterium GWE2_42_42]OFY52502.1 MAG: hypothetical protein A2W93_14250 [Bacteroidetes bacterium GWF2_43_63]HBG71409.1 hypothetical protein [Bacteroidales bacterium]HCB60839.1 hypothetical protein [Bacteroidales bacterium]HCY23436.1 hypothetical protein [Bacteroidales bacterium]